MKDLLLPALLAISWFCNAQIPTNNLMAHFPFNGNAQDMSGNSNHGIVSGPSLSIDRFGNLQGAYSFSNAGDIITISHSNSLNFDGQTDDYSICFWFKSSNGTLGSSSRIMEKWDTDNTVGYPFQISVLSTGELISAVYDVANLPVQSHFGPIWNNQWHLATILFTPLEISTFIDAQLVGTEPNTISGSTANSHDIIIGNNINLTRPYMGALDDIRLYWDKLTPCEISSIYAEGDSVFQTGPLLSTSSVGNSYQWINCDNGDSIIPGATNSVYTPTSNGSYAVIINAATCPDTSVCFTFSTIGIREKLKGSHFSVYPIPAADILNVEANGFGLISYTIYDLMGRRLQSGKLRDGNKLDVSNLKAGTYFLAVTDELNTVIKFQVE